MKTSRMISLLILFVGLAGSAFAYPPQGQSNEPHGKSNKQDKKDNKGRQAKPAKQDKQQGQQAAPQAHSEQRQQPVRRQQARVQPVQQDRPPGWDKGKKTGWGNGNVPPGQQARLPRERQEQIIIERQRQVVVYRQHLDQQQTAAQQYAARLQQDRRTASYRYQQQYLVRLRQQQANLQRAHDYKNDPYYYSAPIYRYDRDGTNYEINQYGADVLRQAVNNGYSQGFRAGLAARQDRWNSPYQDSYAYQDANYGYNGYYVDQADYNYYFRQGFSRGYGDGYNNRYQYGQYNGGNYSILGGILSQILNLQSLR